jgi:ubiquinone/menaquinone biosynthesis C-methylase UbiE
LVTCRFAFHHFEDPAICLREMIRVCRTNGRVSAIDLLAPEEKYLAINYNRLERLRDPSHTQALGLSDFKTLFKAAQLAVAKCETRTIDVEVEAWLKLTDTPARDR